MATKRFSLLTVSALVMLAAVATPLLLGGGVARASSATHKAIFVSSSEIVEGKAKVKISCSAATGTYTLTITNLNVVDADGTSSISGTGNPPKLAMSSPAEGPVFLSQQSNGLWSAASTGVFLPGTCKTGVTVKIANDIGAPPFPISFSGTPS